MGNIFGRKNEVDDQWRKQNEESGTNPCYKLVNLDRTGLLIEAYRHGGTEAVAAIASGKLNSWMYHGGKGVMIPQVKYEEFIQRYHQGNTDELAYAELRNECAIETIKGANNKERPAEHVTDDHHAICWDFQQRGAVGETALHLCFLLDTPIHREVARVLLGVYPMMVFDTYEGTEYYGESCLHLAIVYQDVASVKWLLELGADVHQRATGRFFLPEDQKKTIDYEKSTYEGFAYYGEYALSFAASLGNETIYDHLLYHGADPNAQDSYGNTVLHMAVIHDKKEMFTYATRHHLKKADMSIENKAGLTPLALSCKLGRDKIFQELIRLNSMELWKYSNITATSHPLKDIDTIGPGGKINEGSALMMIVEGKTDKHLQMLEGGVVRQLLEEKWRQYIRRRFLQRMFILILHMALITTAVYTRPHDRQVLKYSTPQHIVRYICEIIVCIGCLTTYILQIEEWKTLGFIRSFKTYKNVPSKFIFMVSCFLILLCIPFRFTGLIDWEESLLIIAVPGSWVFFLFYAKGRVWSGPYITMTYNMCANDMLRAIVIYCVFLLQFTPAFYFLFRDISDTDIDTFATPGGSILSLFKMTMGDFEYEEFSASNNPYLLKIVFTAFMFLVPILLLNLLIASMGSTYQRIQDKADMEWRREWGRIILTMERGYSPKQLLECQQKYAINFKEKSTGQNAQSLMVVHASYKTRAQQRKSAISHWKLLYDKIQDRIENLRNHGRVGELTTEIVFNSEETRVFEIKMFRRSNTMMMGDDFTGTLDNMQFINEIGARIGSASSYKSTSRERRRRRLSRSSSTQSTTEKERPPSRQSEGSDNITAVDIESEVNQDPTFDSGTISCAVDGASHLSTSPRHLPPIPEVNESTKKRRKKRRRKDHLKKSGNAEMTRDSQKAASRKHFNKGYMDGYRHLMKELGSKIRKSDKSGESSAAETTDGCRKSNTIHSEYEVGDMHAKGTPQSAVSAVIVPHEPGSVEDGRAGWPQNGDSNKAQGSFIYRSHCESGDCSVIRKTREFDNTAHSVEGNESHGKYNTHNVAGDASKREIKNSQTGVFIDIESSSAISTGDMDFQTGVNIELVSKDERKPAVESVCGLLKLSDEHATGNRNYAGTSYDKTNITVATDYKTDTKPLSERNDSQDSMSSQQSGTKSGKVKKRSSKVAPCSGMGSSSSVRSMLSD